MKSLLNPFLLVFVCFSLLSLGCSDEPLVGDFGVEDDSDFEDPNADATFQVELDGELFVSENIEATIEEDGFSLIAKADGEEVRIFMPNPTTNTYAFSQDGEEAFISYSNPSAYPGSAFYGNQGSLQITSYNNNENLMSGEFDGTLVEILGIDEDITMTNGIFQDVVFIEVFDDFDFGDINGDFMTALIDGELFFTSDVTAGPLIVEVEDEEGEDGDEGSTEIDPSVTVVVGTIITDVDLPDMPDLPGGGDDDDEDEPDVPDQIIERIRFHFDSDITPGTYDIEPDGQIQAYLEGGTDINELTALEAVEGLIEIQEFSDNQIQAQFKFSGSEGLEVTEGAFRVSQ